ncbi:MAG: hypothetical protein EXR62_07665 [Chloroflexi bacterium]|nr:hypothetical protein [Chloroflexota bacterium]
MHITNPRHAIPLLQWEHEKQELRQSILLLDEARTRGTIIRGAPGSGKTTLVAMIVYGDLIRGKPALVIDAKGALKRQVLKLILRNPMPRRVDLLSRLRLWPVGHANWTYTLPWLHPPGPHSQRAQRFLDVTMKMLPSLDNAPILGKPSLYGIGMPVMMILSSLGYQVTEAIDLLYDIGTIGSFWRSKLFQAERVVPQAVRLLERTYLQWPERTRKERRYAFEAHIFPYLLSDTLRAMAGSTTPFDLETAEAEGLTIFADTSKVEEETVRDTVTLHLFQYFLEYIRRRGVGNVTPWSLVLEEAAILMRTESLVTDVQALANEYRNNRLESTISFQSVNQVSTKLLELLYSFGTHWIGKTSSQMESEIEADFLTTYDPHLVKFEGYASYDSRSGRQTGHNNPMFFSVEEQRRMTADRLTEQQGRQFMVKRYLDEATVDPIVHQVTTTIDTPDTSWITEEDLLQAEEENLKTFAQSVAHILEEVDARLRSPASPQKKAASGKGRQQRPLQLA